ncbi:MAG: hypothetical protein QM820_11850 [Minicystis sp.]
MSSWGGASDGSCRRTTTILIEALVDCRHEAERRAPRPADEPAVLFWVFTGASARLGEDYVTLVIVVTLNHAMSLGRRPAGDPRELNRGLVRWAREIASGVAVFEELCAWFEAHVPEAPH